MTLREVRGFVTGSKKTGRVITAKELRESGEEIICKEMINKNSEIALYKNGLVLYRVGTRSTVFHLPEAGSYSYDSVDTPSVLDGEFFENEVWYMRLIIEGEDRFTENSRKNESKQVNCSYSDFATEYWEEMADPGADFVADLLQQEYIDELMALLTQQQRMAIYSYYIEGMTLDQIAGKMHISHQSVDRLIRRGIASLKHSFQ